MIEEDGTSIVPPVKCTISHARIVDRKPRFRSNRMATDLYTAGIAIKNTGQKDFKI
jgi:hypothetical protein